MPKVRITGWTTQKPSRGRPPEFVRLVRIATARGFWLKYAASARLEAEVGGRFFVTKPAELTPLFAANDLRAIESWLDETDGATP